MEGQTTLGFYGKIPANGDFVTRNLPRTFVDPWDQWLQECMATSREQLGKHWLESYLTGPIWRFALSPGVCSEKAWTGLVMPSVDRAGRYFPLTLAAPVNNASGLLLIADNEEAWFKQTEHIALSALDQNNNLDALTREINNLEAPAFTKSDKPSRENAPEPALGKSTDKSNNWRFMLAKTESVSVNLNSQMEKFLLQRFPDFSLWWTSGSEQVEPSILICDKLPPADGFSAMLSANWEHWGWDNRFNSRASAPIIKTENEIAVESATPVTS